MKSTQTLAPKKNAAPKKPQTIKTDLFCRICKQTLGLEISMEFKFHPVRKWRFDYAITDPNTKIAIEVEGGVFTGGRHTRPLGFLGDMEKYNQAALLGWRVFRVTPEELLKTKTFDMIQEAANPIKIF